MRLKKPTRDVWNTGNYVGWYISMDGTVIQDCVVPGFGIGLNTVKAAFVPAALYKRLLDACR